MVEKNPISFSFKSKKNENLLASYVRTTTDLACLTLTDKASGKTKSISFKREYFAYIEDAYALEQKGSETMLSDWLGVLKDYYDGKIKLPKLRAQTYEFQNNIFKAGKYTYNIGRSGCFWDKRWNHYEVLFKNNKPTLVISEMEGNRNSFKKKPLVICLNRKFYELSDWEEAQISSSEVCGRPKKQIEIINDILENQKRTKQAEAVRVRNMMDSKTR